MDVIVKDMSLARNDNATLIAQRLCHDLVNPLGAIGNGLDLLGMTQPETAETRLMRDSLEQALGRIKIYRLAFGSASSEHLVPGPELTAILSALGGSRPIALETILPDQLNRSDARILALMALCAETALAWGGELTITAEDQTLRASATAPRLRLDREPWAALGRGLPPEAPTPPVVQFSLLASAARNAGRKLHVDQAENRVTITA